MSVGIQIFDAAGAEMFSADDTGLAYGLVVDSFSLNTNSSAVKTYTELAGYANSRIWVYGTGEHHDLMHSVSVAAGVVTLTAVTSSLEAAHYVVMVS